MLRQTAAIAAFALAGIFAIGMVFADPFGTAGIARTVWMIIFACVGFALVDESEGGR